MLGLKLKHVSKRGYRSATHQNIKELQNRVNLSWEYNQSIALPGYIVNLMMTSSNGNIFRVTGPLCGEFIVPGEFPTQRPVTRSFDVFFDLRLNKRLSEQPWGWWFETPSWSLWRQCNMVRHGKPVAGPPSMDTVRALWALFAISYFVVLHPGCNHVIAPTFFISLCIFLIGFRFLLSMFFIVTLLIPGKARHIP